MDSLLFLCLLMVITWIRLKVSWSLKKVNEPCDFSCKKGLNSVDDDVYGVKSEYEEIMHSRNNMRTIES
jgi:hypothetical protein